MAPCEEKRDLSSTATHTLKYVTVDEAVMKQHYFVSDQSSSTFWTFHS